MQEYKMITEKVVKAMSNLLEFRGNLQNEHTERVECFLRTLVEELYNRNLYTGTMRFWNMELFFQAAALHDVGKIAIPENILLKRGKLNPGEFNQMKNHTVYGEQIIGKVRENFPNSKMLAQAQIIAGTHHERWDGKGYPRGLAGDNIPLEGRFMAVADVFDTLMSERSYKKASSFSDALKVIKSERGTHFDPQITDAFVNASRHLHGIHTLSVKSAKHL
jgi:putative two-component system response regulator